MTENVILLKKIEKRSNWTCDLFLFPFFIVICFFFVYFFEEFVDFENRIVFTVFGSGNNGNLLLQIQELDEKREELLKQMGISEETRNFTKFGRLIKSKSELSMRRHHRKVDHQIWELFRYLKSELNRNDSENLEDHVLNQMITLLATSQNLKEIDSNTKKASLQRLTNKIQKKLTQLQNPRNCSEARFLVFDLNVDCGFGCQLHHVVFSFFEAFSEGRTLIFRENGKTWRYSKSGWLGRFLPITNCTFEMAINEEQIYDFELNSRHRLLEYPIFANLDKKFRSSSLPPIFPEQFEQEMIELHSNPPAFFVGQFTLYLMKGNSEMNSILKSALSMVSFGKEPIVGVQVRRTDKWIEAKLYSIDEYMQWVEIWYQIQETRLGHPLKRRVYVASDGPNVIPEIKNNYSNYEIFGDLNFSLSASEKDRYSDVGLLGVVTDLELLSRCDFLVCTFSSNIGRLAYELMQVKGSDGDQAHSLDMAYYYSGENPHEQITIEDYNPEKDGEIELRKGDVIFVPWYGGGNLYNGFSRGTNLRTNKEGRYPSYKTVEKWRTFHFKALD